MRLRVLVLAGNPLGPAGVAAIARALSGRPLRLDPAVAAAGPMDAVRPETLWRESEALCFDERMKEETPLWWSPRCQFRRSAKSSRAPPTLDLFLPPCFISSLAGQAELLSLQQLDLRAEEREGRTAPSPAAPPALTAVDLRATGADAAAFSELAAALRHNHVLRRLDLRRNHPATGRAAENATVAQAAAAVP